ncbi:MAG: hypothetical protein WEG40_09555 [Candidatus Rokuibacteriota bacterium]
MTKTHRSLLLGTALLVAAGAPAPSALATHVPVSPQPGLDREEADRLVHLEHSKRTITQGVIGEQVRLGTAYIRLAALRLAAGQVEEGPTGWREPAYLGYKLVSGGIHGLELKLDKNPIEATITKRHIDLLDLARAPIRHAIDRAKHTRDGDPKDIAFATEKLQQGLTLLRQAQAVIP